MRSFNWIVLLLAAGCAKPQPTSTVTLTAAQMDAAEFALKKDDPAQALALAERALHFAPNDPYALYERATALAELGRTDEAVLAYSRVATLYGDAHPRGKGLAMYGRARVLAKAGRCVEAQSAYESYAELARASDSAAADMALAYARDCRPSVPRAPDLTAIDHALMAKDYPRALALADEKSDTARAPAERARLDEARGMALVGLGRNVEAVEVLEGAAGAFGEAGDRDGRARALYAEAHALRAASSCAAAARAYARYAAFVRPFAPEDADLAERYARACPR